MHLAHWSIAQTKNRETTAEGIGWELFRNYVISREKYQPDYFLYENNKSMAPAIRQQITAELGVEPVLINSALVSAQNRQRLYWVGKRNPDGTYSQVPVEQPEDRGILLRDILESGVCWREKGYTLRASHGPHGGVSSVLKTLKEPGKFSVNGVAEPVRVGTICDFYGTLDKPIYEVRDGHITIKGKEYPIKLRDGYYIIRKLTVTECMRLQTVPDTYLFPVSNTQAYKMLGNGWTVDVIAHIMSHFEGLTADPVEVFGMYDGMSCGHIALDKLGVDVAAYYATEIDKFAIETTLANYPETIQLGDAFQVREDGWSLPHE